jgi:hypothetical protein
VIRWVYTQCRECDLCGMLEKHHPDNPYYVIKDPEEALPFEPIDDKPPEEGSHAHEAGWRRVNGKDLCADCLQRVAEHVENAATTPLS